MRLRIFIPNIFFILFVTTQKRYLKILYTSDLNSFHFKFVTTKYENEKFLMVADLHVALAFCVNIGLSHCRAVEEYYFLRCDAFYSGRNLCTLLTEKLHVPLKVCKFMSK
jgi:hypothetical protein